MSIVKLDLGALLSKGDITQAEAVRLSELAMPESRGTLWINLLLIFGALAVACGVIGLAPSTATGLVLAFIALTTGGFLKLSNDAGWRVLSAGLAIMGAIGLVGSIAVELGQTDAILWPALLITGIFTATALWFRSRFLMTLAVLSLSGAIGSGTAYWHASYGVFVKEPTLTIAVFSVLILALYALIPRLEKAWQDMASIAARTSFFVANMAFWVGSLWGDHVGELWASPDGWSARSEWRENAVYVSELVFSFGWLIALGLVIAKAKRGSFLSVTSIVFLAIHAYTQFFETLGAEPLTLVIGGVTAVGLAFAGARWYQHNKSVQTPV